MEVLEEEFDLVQEQLRLGDFGYSRHWPRRDKEHILERDEEAFVKNCETMGLKKKTTYVRSDGWRDIL